jgi:hypothetical protein
MLTNVVLVPDTLTKKIAVFVFIIFSLAFLISCDKKKGTA